MARLFTPPDSTWETSMRAHTHKQVRMASTTEGVRSHAWVYKFSRPARGLLLPATPWEPSSCTRLVRQRTGYSAPKNAIEAVLGWNCAATSCAKFTWQRAQSYQGLCQYRRAALEDERPSKKLAGSRSELLKRPSPLLSSHVQSIFGLQSMSQQHHNLY